jgi:hypothetical protein
MLTSTLLPLLLTGPALAQPPADLPLVVDQIVTSVTDGDFTAAAERAQGTIDSMASWTTPPDPAQFAALWQILGAVGVYDEQDALIAASFSQACAIDSEHFDQRLGPRAHSQWEAACRHVQPSASLTVGPLQADSMLWIDGREAASNPAALAPGQHLLQVLTPEREPFVALVTLTADQQASVDTGLVLPAEPSKSPRALLASAAGVSLAAGAALGVLAWQAQGLYAPANETCSASDRSSPCSDDSLGAIDAQRGLRNGYLLGAGLGGGLGLALGTTLVITW